MSPLPPSTTPGVDAAGDRPGLTAAAEPPSGTAGGTARAGITPAGPDGERGAIRPLRLAPPPGAGDPPALAAATAPTARPGAALAAVIDAAAGVGMTGAGAGGDGATRDFDASGGAASGGLLDLGDAGLFDVVGGDASVTQGDFSHFVLYTLDYNYGTVLFPGFVHYAKLGAPVDLRAQVRDDTASTYSFSWDTSQIDGSTGSTYATSITGTASYRLQFTWATNNPTAATQTVTLTATNGLGEQEVQTYSFRIPSGSVGSGGGSAPSWPEAIGGDLLLPGTAAFASHYGAVDAASGAFGTAVALPAYSPNFPGLVLAYDSLAAEARPIVLERHPLDPAQAAPTKTSASLTFNGGAGTTYYYDTAKLAPGSIQQIALQADATALATGRYDYTVTVADYRAATTTVTVTGKLNVVNEASSAFGAGWTLAGLARVHEVTGGVVLGLGAGARSLWFASAGGGYTTPKGDFSTLTKTGSGGATVFTRTLKDGTKQEFRADGRQRAAIDRNGLRVTFSYDGSDRLQTITDPYAKVTTLAYDGNGKLRTITDPAGRVATFTVNGTSGTLTSVKLPDNALWTFTYDAAKRITRVTDPRAKLVTVAYDAAGRVGTITRPDASTQTFTPYQERGYDTSGTAGSPAPAVLFAEARGTHTDPNGNTSDVRGDWNGLGVANQLTDPAGNVATAYVDPNGLATATLDRLNRINTYTYDSKGNVTGRTHPDGNRVSFTYNGFSEVTEAVDERNNRTTLTYDGAGNLTEVRDALNNRTTLTYTANGRVATVQDARSNVTSFQYDNQDRLATDTYPGGATTKLAYDAKGNVATLTNERGNSTTYSYDALNRLTGTQDALGNKASYTYDSGGNRTVAQLPTPSGQTARTTTYAYDAMNRLTTITAPLSRTTVLGYDSGGRLVTTKDPLNRLTTQSYDALDRLTVLTAPQEGATVRRVTLTYDAEGQALTQADFLNRVTTTTYTSRGQVHTVTDPLGNTTTYTYTATVSARRITSKAALLKASWPVSRWAVVSGGEPAAYSVSGNRLRAMPIPEERPMRPTGSASYLEWRRFRAIELMDQGEPRKLIARIFGVSPTSLSRWRKRADAGELEAKPIPGAPRRLTDQDFHKLEGLLLQGATAHGWLNDLWTGARVARVIERNFGVKYHRAHVCRLLVVCHPCPVGSSRRSCRMAIERHPAGRGPWPRSIA